MTKIFLLEAGQYSDKRTIMAFTDEDLADTVLKSMGGADDELRLLEVDIKKKKDFPLEVLNGLQCYEVVMFKDGNIDSIHITDWSNKTFNKPEFEKPPFWTVQNDPSHKGKLVMRLYTWAMNSNHAIKITNEVRARNIALDRWPEPNK